jgi:hypothetical protein
MTPVPAFSRSHKQCRIFSRLLNPGNFRAAATVAPQIYHMRQGSLPQFQFEWHPAKQIVYVIDVEMGARTGRPTGNAIAHDVTDHGQAWNAVLIWTRGFHAGNEARSHNDSGKTVLLGVDS